MPRKTLELLGAQVLVAKVKHQMCEKGMMDFGERLGAEAPSQPDTGDLGTQGAGDERDRNVLIAIQGCSVSPWPWFLNE